MDELKKNNTLHIVLKNGSKITGTVEDYQKDRVMVHIAENCIDIAKSLNELDELKVTAMTSFGVKMMTSSVISTLNSSCCIVIENNPSVPVEQKRGHVRAVDDFKFQIKNNDNIYIGQCLNISASGLAFKTQGIEFEVGEIVDLVFPKEVYLKAIECSIEILRKNNDHYTSRFNKINEHDADKIVKRIFKLLSRK